MTDTGDNKDVDSVAVPSKAGTAVSGSAAEGSSIKASSAEGSAIEGSSIEEPGSGAAADGAFAGRSGADTSDQFNRKLREVYSDVLDAPVPDRFLDLLARLDAKGAGEKDADTN